MSVLTLDCFKTLQTTHENPLDFLASQDGGNFRVCGKPEDPFRIVRYDKKSTDMKSPLAKWMRSTVWDTTNNVPVCISPPKAEDAEQPPCGDELLIQDFLDGTMVNMFWYQNENDEWVSRYATRSQLDAGGNFYSQRSFKELFEDAKAAHGITNSDLEMAIRAVVEVTNASSYFGSFLLQHPEHRVVSRVQTPTIFAIQVGCVLEDGTVKLVDVNTAHSQMRHVLRAVKQYPMTGFKTEADYNSFVTNLMETKSWFWQGLTFKDKNGRRWRLRNKNYLTLRALRGSEAQPLDRWLRLRRDGNVLEYLKHYSEERQVFWDFEQRFRQMTSDVFTAYCSVHKAHSSKLVDHPKHISPCVFRLHAYYLEHLKPKNETVRMKDAIEVINGMTLLEQRQLMTPRGGGAPPAPPAEAQATAIPPEVFTVV